MSEGFVYIPVPHRWAPAIYAKLTDLSRHEGAVAPAVEVPDGPDNGGGPEPPVLDADLIRRMFNESDLDGGQQRLMRHLAKSPDVWHYTSELGAVLNRNHGARGIAGMLGAFGRRAKHRYGGLTPWVSEWDPAKGEMRHKLTAEVAAVINQIDA
jgi:hypothetical protein